MVMEMLQTETIIAVAVISAIAAGLVNVIKTLFSRNQNVKDQHEYDLALVNAVQGNNVVLQEIKQELVSINNKVDSLSARIDRIEKDLYEE